MSITVGLVTLIAAANLAFIAGFKRSVIGTIILVFALAATLSFTSITMSDIVDILSQEIFN